MSLFAELRRRNVFRVSAAYIVVSWLVLQVADTLVPALRLPDWAVSLVALILLLGFPFAVFLSWAFDLTPEGLVREHASSARAAPPRELTRRFDAAIIAILVIALGYFIWESRFRTGDSSPRTVASIAVLPFANLSGDESQVWFSDGLSEELLLLLAKIPQLRVVSRSSSFAYRDQSLHIRDLGERLEVDHVLEGSVRRFGERVRISAQLVDVRQDRALWVQSWDRDLIDIFEIQNEIASSVVNALKIELLDAPPVARTTSPEAYNLYLRARHTLSDRTVDSYALAQKLIERALEIDPNYAPAWVRLGYIYAEQAKTGLREFREGYRLARDAVTRALLIEPDGQRAKAFMAEVALRYDRDFVAAREHVAAALKADPNDLENNLHAAYVYKHVGDFERAARHAEKAVSIDPSFSPALIVLGYAYMYLGRHDEAIDVFRELGELNPNAFGSRYYLGTALLLDGKPAAALPLMQDEPLGVYRETGLALVHHSLGNHEESDAALQRLIDRYGDIGAYQVAEVYGWRGEPENAVDWLERAVELYDTGIIMMVGDPLLDSARRQPRFASLLQRLRLDPVR